jgi:hypothetical protein
MSVKALLRGKMLVGYKNNLDRMGQRIGYLTRLLKRMIL